MFPGVHSAFVARAITISYIVSTHQNVLRPRSVLKSFSSFMVVGQIVDQAECVSGNIATRNLVLVVSGVWAVALPLCPIV